MLIYYLSYLYFPAVLLLGICGWKSRGFSRVACLVLIFGLSVLAYARFIEPRLITVQQTEILLPGADETSDSVTFLLFSDTHLGLFGNAMPIERLSKRAKALDYDAVLVAGDFTYHPELDALPDLFDALQDFDKPVYGVFGNHDVGLPGPDLSLPLTGYFQTLDGFELLQNRTTVLNIDGLEVWLTGTSDLWQRRISYPQDNPPPGVPRIILTHNPDLAIEVPADVQFDLMFAGHTHGGQIRIPGLYESHIPSEYGFDMDLHEVMTQQGERPVFVTSGTGMVGLPMRFLIPPRLDLVTVRLANPPDQPELATDAN
ncbi:MAG: hypothetical protein CMK07_04080 [Ponticaulis sp.]|nr:hypothetical protein [Ponticaulis sp.]